ncbi:hypothetical protein BFS14_06520 [Serratia fonticola]|nr:GNAT family N-acetyltransferase [Serratia fonticola]OIX86393.1 hypothetical protein BFS14_06520 [Serratia fonticola]QCR61719.1 GNAT family N-acetyltransferase [Serratia fonticola]
MEISVVRHISDFEIKELQDLLKVFNSQFTDTNAWGTQVGVYCHDEVGEMIGGTIATKKGQWLCIDYLWTKEGNRRKGLGKTLMNSLEEEGRILGCSYAMVDTFSFQALSFYEKSGYTLQFSLSDFPHSGAARHFLTKKLTVNDFSLKEVGTMLPSVGTISIL